MGTEAQHKKLYERNKKLSKSDLISKPENRDWKITMRFYSILHLMDSRYASTIHPYDHRERREIIETQLGSNIFSCYKVLEKLSQKSRYDCIKITEKNVNDAEKIATILEKKICN